MNIKSAVLFLFMFNRNIRTHYVGIPARLSENFFTPVHLHYSHIPRKLLK